MVSAAAQALSGDHPIAIYYPSRSFEDNFEFNEAVYSPTELYYYQSSCKGLGKLLEGTGSIGHAAV